jgi:hypothetical protein
MAEKSLVVTLGYIRPGHGPEIKASKIKTSKGRKLREKQSETLP